MMTMATAGMAPTSMMAGRQNQSGCKDRPAKPTCHRVLRQPSPRLPSQTASGSAGSSRTLRLYPGMVLAKAAMAAARPVASAAVCSMRKRASVSFVSRSARGDITTMTSAM